MTKSGQPDPQLEVDLTSSPVEATPSERGNGAGISADFRLTLSWSTVKLAFRMTDKTAVTRAGMDLLIRALAVVVLVGTVGAILLLVGAAPGLVAACCMVVFFVGGILIFVVHRIERRHAHVDLGTSHGQTYHELPIPRKAARSKRKTSKGGKQQGRRNQNRR